MRYGARRYVFTKDHHSGGPYVMFGRTPYEHLMVPVE
jgi:hypothetical protein